MDDTSNSGSGIGLSRDEAAQRISGILDSENAATVEDTGGDENETLEVSQPFDEVDESPEEQVGETSDELVDDDSDEATETEEADKTALRDDLEIEVKGEKLTLKELKDGYERTADYTRKTQALAEVKRAKEAEVEQLRAGTKQYLANLERELSINLPHEPNWAQLAQDDPVQYVQEVERWKSINAQREFLRKEQNVLEQKKQEKQAADHVASVAESKRLLAQLHPELAVEGNGKADALGQYLVSQGIAHAAIEHETNHILFSIAYKAQLYDEMQKQKAQAVKKVDAKPLLTTPGSSQAGTKRGQSNYEKQLSNLKRSGSREDAAAVLAYHFK